MSSPPYVGPPQIGPYFPTGERRIPILQALSVEHELPHGAEDIRAHPRRVVRIRTQKSSSVTLLGAEDIKAYPRRFGRVVTKKIEHELPHGAEDIKAYPRRIGRVFVKRYDEESAKGERLQRTDVGYGTRKRAITNINASRQAQYERAVLSVQLKAGYEERKEKQRLADERAKLNKWWGGLSSVEQLEYAMTIDPKTYQTPENIQALKDYYDVANAPKAKAVPEVPKSVTQQILDLPNVPVDPLNFLKRGGYDTRFSETSKQFVGGVVSVPESYTYAIANIVGIKTPPVPLSPSGWLGAEGQAGHLKVSPLETLSRRNFRPTQEMGYMTTHPAYLVGGLVGEIALAFGISKATTIVTTKVSSKVSEIVTGRAMEKYVEYGPLSLSKADRWVLEKFPQHLAPEVVNMPHGFALNVSSEFMQETVEYGIGTKQSLLFLQKFPTQEVTEFVQPTVWIEGVGTMTVPTAKQIEVATRTDKPLGSFKKAPSEYLDEPLGFSRYTFPYSGGLAAEPQITRTISLGGVASMPYLPEMEATRFRPDYFVAMFSLRSSSPMVEMEVQVPSAIRSFAMVVQKPALLSRSLDREKTREAFNVSPLARMDVVLKERQRDMMGAVLIPATFQVPSVAYASMVKLVQVQSPMVKLVQMQSVKQMLLSRSELESQFALPTMAYPQDFVPDEWKPKRGKKRKDFKRTVGVRHYRLLYPTWTGAKFLKKMERSWRKR